MAANIHKRPSFTGARSTDRSLAPELQRPFARALAAQGRYRVAMSAGVGDYTISKLQDGGVAREDAVARVEAWLRSLDAAAPAR